MQEPCPPILVKWNYDQWQSEVSQGGLQGPQSEQCLYHVMVLQRFTHFHVLVEHALVIHPSYTESNSLSLLMLYSYNLTSSSHASLPYILVANMGIFRPLKQLNTPASIAQYIQLLSYSWYVYKYQDVAWTCVSYTLYHNIDITLHNRAYD